MTISEFENPKKSLVLFELNQEFDLLIKLYKSNKFPKTLMLTGKKGIGKFTIINHFLNFIFDRNNYDLKKNIIKPNSDFNKQYLNDTFSNIIYLDGSKFKNSKIEDIRNLKSTIIKSSLSQENRFIILDDIELFNINSSNAILKMIEEPSEKNYFILINNQNKSLLETIHSRSIEIKIFLSNEKRINIIESLIKKNNLDIFFDFKENNITPGNFLIFNNICKELKINFDKDLLINIEILLTLYKKTKNMHIINMILFLTDCYFYSFKKKKNEDIEKIIENKMYVVEQINKFVLYNLNQNSLINDISNKLSNE